MLNHRSFLYVPGDAPDKVTKAASRAADAVILDLEDAVPPLGKDMARKTVGAFLSDPPSSPPWWVRINASDVRRDIDAVTWAGLTGVVVPKADLEILSQVHEALADVERARNLAPGSVAVIALLETAKGLLQAAEVAQAPRVGRLGLGEADLAAELCLQPGPAGEELWPLRSYVVLASAAAGIAPPIGPVEAVLGDTSRLEASCRTLLRQGFRGRTAIHPNQIEMINLVFTPTRDEVSAARDVVARLATAQRNGAGVAMTSDGRFVDAAVARSAREILGRA